MSKVLFAGIVAGITAFAAAQTLTGVVTDSMCNMNHATIQKGANKMSAHDCTLACVKSGQKYVLATGNTVYEITNQNFAGLEKNAGRKVRLTGQVSADGKAVTLSKITPAGK